MELDSHWSVHLWHISKRWSWHPFLRIQHVSACAFMDLTGSDYTLLRMPTIWGDCCHRMKPTHYKFSHSFSCQLERFLQCMLLFLCRGSSVRAYPVRKNILMNGHLSFTATYVIVIFQCVVQSYLQWLDDSDYNPVCRICDDQLATGECIRLVCYGKKKFLFYSFIVVHRFMDRCCDSSEVSFRATIELICGSW